MSVIMDIEWVKDGKKPRYLTQLAAVRTDDRWKETDCFSRIFAPPPTAQLKWHPVAYKGYRQDDFLSAGLESDGLREFAAWLQPEEQVYIWDDDAKRVLAEQWQQALASPPPPMNSLRKPVLVQGKASGDSYAVAKKMGIELPSPKHRAENDVQVLRAILVRLGIKAESLCTPAALAGSLTPLPMEMRIQRNRRILANSNYNFVYTPDSRIFHKSSCPCILNAKQIRGSTYYRTSATNRIPCQLCKPIDDHMKPAPNPPPSPASSSDPNALTQVTLFDGTMSWLRNSEIVGYCNSVAHPGLGSRELLKKHRCLGKGCRYLYKYKDCVYWKNRIIKTKEANREKEKKKASREQKRSEEQRLLGLREEFQSFVSCSDTEIEIVRVELLRNCVYRVFYVSENRFADKHLFPELYECVSHYHPGCRIVLKHIRDVDGHFVTIDEYHRRRKK